MQFTFFMFVLQVLTVGALYGEQQEPFFIPNIAFVVHKADILSVVEWKTVENTDDKKVTLDYACSFKPTVSLKGVFPKNITVRIPALIRYGAWQASRWKWILHVPQSHALSLLALSGDDSPAPFPVPDEHISTIATGQIQAIGSNFPMIGNMEEIESGIASAIADIRQIPAEERRLYLESKNPCERRLIVGDLLERPTDANDKISDLLTSVLKDKDEPLELRQIASNRAQLAVDNAELVASALLDVCIDVSDDQALRLMSLESLRMQISNVNKVALRESVSRKIASDQILDWDHVVRKYQIMYNGNSYGHADVAEKFIAVRKEILDALRR